MLPPITYPIDGQAFDRVIAPDCRNYLVRLDAQNASNAVPPVKVWEQFGVIMPVIVTLSGGAKGVAASSRIGIRTFRADGSLVWSTNAPATMLNDMIPANLDGDGVTDLVFHWGYATDTLLQTRAISGVNGAVKWDAAAFEPGSGGSPPARP